ESLPGADRIFAGWWMSGAMRRPRTRESPLPSRVRVREFGKGGGTPILLLHGFTGSSEAWGGKILQTLGHHTRVLAVDLPGHGSAIPLPASRGVGFEQVVGDLVGALSTRGIARADWVGYSMGGRIALAAAAGHPSRVRRLVLESASPGLEWEADRTERRRADERLASTIESRGIDWFVEHWMSLPLFASQASLPEPLLTEARERRRANDPASLAAALRLLGTGSQPSFWDELEGMTVPTLLLTGALDEKFVAIADAMSERMPRARHERVAGVGHTVHLEAPHRWLDAVCGFLSRDSD
ncbi:MAG: 2-succinyl-6-hydroxy-2,4-cyclohexadiene-1-carboxylate synthase, partial [Gemmatimonadota bacterium]